MDIVNEDAKRALIDKETELEGIQDCTPLSKVKIRADIAQLQKSGRGCPLLEVILYGGRSFGVERRVRCPEFRGGRFSEVANVLYIRDFRSVTRILSALGSVSASRSVRSERFNCIQKNLY